MQILVQAEAEVEITNDVTSKRNQLSKDFGQVRLELYHWEENWRMVKMCQRFLYRISPIAWRVEHDWIYRSDSGENISSASTNDLFGRYRIADDTASLEVLIGDPSVQKGHAHYYPVTSHLELVPVDSLIYENSISSSKLHIIIAKEAFNFHHEHEKEPQPARLGPHRSIYEYQEAVKCYFTFPDLFEQDIAEAGPADMYFEDPLDLVRVFRTIATQNLNALIHLESLAQPMTEMMTMIETAEDQIKSRVDELTTAINELQVNCPLV